VKASLVECILGILAFDETNKLVEKTLFPKDPTKIAEKLAKIEAGKLIDEIEFVIANLKKQGYTLLIFENTEIAHNTYEKLKITIEVAKPSEAGEFVRANLEDLGVKLGFVKEASELRLLLHKVSVELTKMRVRKAVEKRDLVVMQAIMTIDDLDRTVNLFMGRIREWYGLHFPELDRLIEKHETYARLIIDLGKRDNYTSENLENEGLPKAKSEQIAMVAEKSMGADLEENDLTQIHTLCKNTLQLHEARQSLENYMDLIMEEAAPNVKSLAGSLLGARLIALTGGLTNLAKMPASTIQVLGAERALFRSLKTGTRPPKHGIIFQHTLIHEAKRWQRGKMARAIAGKLAIAARTDAFSGKYIGDSLQAGLNKRIEEIQKKYEAPPPARKPSVQQPRLKDKPNRRMKRGHRR
jgi:nucleolar protein 56